MFRKISAHYLSAFLIGVIGLLLSGGLFLLAQRDHPETTPWLSTSSNALGILSVGVTLSILFTLYVLTLARYIVRIEHNKAALQVSEERYNSLSQLMSDYAFGLRVEPDGILTPEWVTEAFTRITGFTLEELKHKSFWQVLVHPDDTPLLGQLRQQLLAGQRAITEMRLVTRSGDIRWIRNVAQPVWDTPHGRLTYIYGAAQDITEQKKAELELRRLTAELQAIITSAMDAIITLDDAQCVTLFNGAAERMFGCTAAEVLGQPLERFLPERFRTVHRQHIQHFAATDITNRSMAALGAVYGVRANGEEFPLEASISQIEVAGHKLFTVILRDVTRRQESENVLREQTALALLETEVSLAFAQGYALEGMFRHCAELTVKHLDAALARLWLFNDTTNTLELHASAGLYTHLDGAHSRVPLGQFKIGKIAQTRQAHFTNAVGTDPLVGDKAWAGREGLIAFAGYPLVAGDRLIGVIAIFSRHALSDFVLKALGIIADKITHGIERLQAQEVLRQMNETLEHRVQERTIALSAANAELAKATRLKDEFLASMSHELRTPLNAILGLSEALQEEVYGRLTAKQLESLGRIEDSGRHLLSLINDILDLSKIEAGKVELQLDDIPIQELCKASLRLVQEVVNEKHLTVHLHIDSTVATVCADNRRLKQILVNLLSNAVKFTPAGGAVGLEVTGLPEEETVRFTIWDTGIGIAAADMSRLFQPFVQLDSSLARQHQGTGLGLALVARLTELHRGSVAVESTVGEGSRFSLTLPWAPPPASVSQPAFPALATTARTTAPQPDAVAPCILLAEDNDSNIATLTDYLTAKGYHMQIAYNGKEAVAHAQAFRPALILMDIQMPIMDGLEATRCIRAFPDMTVATTPIIALTALAMPGDRERCLQAGANEYLTKPVSLKGLVKMIEQILKG